MRFSEAHSFVVQVDRAGTTAAVSIPALEEEKASGSAVASATSPVAPAAAATATTPVARESEGPSNGGSRRTVGLVTAAVGLVGIGAGVLFETQAASKMSDADAWCNGDQCWDQRGVDLRSRAVSRERLAWVVGGLGTAAVITGAVLYFTAPSDKPKTAGSKVSVFAFSPGSASVGGTF